MAQSPVGGCNRWKSTRRAWGSVHQHDVHASADLAYGWCFDLPSKPVICYGHFGSVHHMQGHRHTFSVSVLVLKKQCLRQAADPEMEVHQDMCVNAIATLLCLSGIQVTSLQSCLFSHKHNKCLPASLFSTNICLYGWGQEEYKSKVIAFSKLLPAIAWVTAQSCPRAFCWRDAACSGPLRVPRRCSCCGAHQQGSPCSHFTLTYFLPSKAASAETQTVKVGSCSSSWLYWVQSTTHFIQAVHLGCGLMKRIYTHPRLPGPLAPRRLFCCVNTSIRTFNELDLVADPSGLLKQALPPRTCMSAYRHWHNPDFRSSVWPSQTEDSQFP